MEIIDRKHPEISKRATGKYNSFISFPNAKEIYFSSAAANELNLKADDYLHFAILDKGLYFYVDGDIDSGYKMHADGKPNTQALKVINQVLIDFIICKFPVIKFGSRFNLLKTDSLMKEQSSLIEVLLSPKKPTELTKTGYEFSKPRF